MSVNESGSKRFALAIHESGMRASKIVDVAALRHGNDAVCLYGYQTRVRQRRIYRNDVGIVEDGVNHRVSHFSMPGVSFTSGSVALASACGLTCLCPPAAHRIQAEHPESG